MRWRTVIAQSIHYDFVGDPIIWRLIPHESYAMKFHYSIVFRIF